MTSPSAIWTQSYGTDTSPCAPCAPCADLAQPVDANLSCSICLSLFSNPVRASCGHVYCRSCIVAWLDENDACPTCRTSVDKEELAPDRLAAALVDNVQSFCEFRHAGCSWVGRRADAAHHHASSCPGVTVSCPRCHQEMRRCDVWRHSTSCSAAAAPPPHAAAAPSAAEAAAGGVDAEAEEACCPFGCGARPGALLMQSHIEGCLLEPRKLMAAIRHLQHENERLTAEMISRRAKDESYSREGDCASSGGEAAAAAVAGGGGPALSSSTKKQKRRASSSRGPGLSVRD